MSTTAAAVPVAVPAAAIVVVPIAAEVALPLGRNQLIFPGISQWIQDPTFDVRVGWNEILRRMGRLGSL